MDIYLRKNILTRHDPFHNTMSPHVQTMLNIKVVCLPVFWGSVSERVQHEAGIAASGVSHMIWHSMAYFVKDNTIFTLFCWDGKMESDRKQNE